MKRDINKIIEQENQTWSKIFQAELKKNHQKLFSSYWWESYYQEITKCLNKIILEYKLTKILEAGCGSGKATILLDEALSKTLLDISPVALKYSKHIAKKFNHSKKIKYISGDIFSLPFNDSYFDFIWNIGVIEHYELNEIKKIIKEMIRVCSKPGIVAIGMPNFSSGPILKARLLRKLNFIPGYKLNTEKFYEPYQIKKILENVGKKMGKTVTDLKIEYFGNPLIMETPGFILKTVGQPVSYLFKKRKFLIMIICRFD